ncbi:hypothetical protein TSOC_003355 [Tetrabaena socialis]|uniref:Uncharacterized protein n=1 Tax=Tetrabaena socialis TaxID=47790 RepID=A0A2J8ABS2_9CHLO|nr:hypothetical protein TSOC_003355 [Tetrabaena socialis]|eukprot:PNH09974.1 hypothetical protein TSOC_003355 [Tetrabaena socialis]
MHQAGGRSSSIAPAAASSSERIASTRRSSATTTGIDSALDTFGTRAAVVPSFLSSPLALARVLMRWPWRLSGMAICTHGGASP